MTKFDEIYQTLVRKIMVEGITEVSERTRHETKALPGVHFQIDLEKDGFPILTLRKTPIKMFVAEQVWFIAGSRKPEEMLRSFTKIWDDFTNPQDVVTVAYGYRWRKHFGRDQLGLLIELLQKEPSSRQGVVITWDPAQDGLSLFKKKNVPCPYTFTANIIGGRLHFHNIIRSNDIILGLPSDVPGFALLASILAQKLKVRPGIYSHSISNAHIYDSHYFAAEEIMKRENDHEPLRLALPKNSFDRAEKKDKKLVEEIVANLEKQYKPLEPIKGIKIVL
ncbi:MAG: Thymidylate synthase [Parcubacteria group bacterium GW2011_GWA2_47_21]|nr:MAG: Thymidylate synthase [Parcubacteria group bacterium GW2011_GWA2_47_21]